MTALAVALFGLSLALLLWSYGVYPRLIERLGSRALPPTTTGAAPASIEVVVSAADEERVIGNRVANLLAQEFAGSYRIAIGCDGSRDRTAEIARASLGGGGRVLEFPARRGKAAVLNDLVDSSNADLLIFTDANTRFESGAVSRLAEAFRDPDVGAACGRLVIEGSEAESAFWDRETRVKEAEGRLGVCLGANGAIYAALRAEVERLPVDTTSMDDFLIPLHVARRGRQVVFVGDAVAREGASRDVRGEMGRRFRIGVGGGQILRRERWLWRVWRRPDLSLAFFSRKMARWMIPVTALTACGVACASPLLWPAGAVAAAVIALLALSARAGSKPIGMSGRLYYFAVINLALGAGVIAGLFGYSRAAWKPVAREAWPR